MSSLSGFSLLGDWRFKSLSYSAEKGRKTPWTAHWWLTELSLLLSFEYMLLVAKLSILFGLLYTSPCILTAPSFSSDLFLRGRGGVGCRLPAHTLLFLTQMR